MPHEMLANEANGDEGPGDRLTEAIRTLGVTQVEMARRTKVGPAYINDVIRGRRSLTEAFADRLQLEFGIDRIWLRHGEGQMLRRLPLQGDPKGGLALVPVPLLERPCPGNPLDSDHWLGSTHHLPRGLARPSIPEHHRYVLRVTTCAPRGEIRPGDLVLVENIAKPNVRELELCWCTALIRREATVLQIKTSHRVARVQIWGRCLGVVWRALSPLD